MSLRWLSHLFAGAILTWSLSPGTVCADMTTWTGSGSDKDGALEAKATITTDGDTLTIVLTNSGDPGVFKQGNAVSGLDVTFNGVTLTLKSVSGTGQVGNVDGTTVDYTGGPNSALTRWPDNSSVSTDKNNNSTFKLLAIGGGQPDNLIAPYVADGGSFPKGPKDQFNPYVIGPATFTVSLTGMTASMTPDKVTFFFGTKPDGSADGVLVSAPEPSTLVLAGVSGLVMLGMARRSRKS